MNRQLRRREAKITAKSTGGRTADQQKWVSSTIANIDQMLRTGRHVKARRECDAAIAEMSDCAELYNARGVVEQARNNMPAALEAYRQATDLAPDYLAAWVNLGVMARATQDRETALEAFGRALEIDPKSLHAAYNRALIYCDLKMMDEAVADLERAIAAKPDFADAHHQLAFLLELQENYDAAIDAYKQAIRYNPTSSAAELALGSCLQVIGRFDEAAEHLKKAVSLKPGAGRAHYLLAYSDQADTSAETRDRLEEIAATPSLAMDDRIYVHFAAANLNERAGEYDRAFGHYETANSLRDSLMSFDEAAMRAQPDQIADVFDMNFFARNCACGDETEKPVFIVGMPRSGTTLLEQIVASHPRAIGIGEPGNMYKIGAVPRAPQTPEEAYPLNASSLTPDDITRLAERYLADYPPTAADADRIADKTPGNALVVGLLGVMFPNATFIHCLRDPMDSCWSIYRHQFMTHLSYSCDLHKIGVYYDAYRRTMRHWQRLMGERIIDVQYEDVVAEPEAQVRRILDHIGLEWDDRCLAFHETERGVHSSSLWQVRKPIFKTSIARWKNFESHLDPLKQALGDWLET